MPRLSGPVLSLLILWIGLSVVGPNNRPAARGQDGLDSTDIRVLGASFSAAPPPPQFLDSVARPADPVDHLQAFLVGAGLDARVSWDDQMGRPGYLLRLDLGSEACREPERSLSWAGTVGLMLRSSLAEGGSIPAHTSHRTRFSGVALDCPKRDRQVIWEDQFVRAAQGLDIAPSERPLLFSAAPPPAATQPSPPPPQEAPRNARGWQTNVARFEHEIQAAAAAFGLDADTLAAIMWVESGGAPSALGQWVWIRARSRYERAIGLMQVMPFEVERRGVPLDSALAPSVNVALGAWVLHSKLQGLGSYWERVRGYYGYGDSMSDEWLRRVQREWMRIRAAR